MISMCSSNMIWPPNPYISPNYCFVFISFFFPLNYFCYRNFTHITQGKTQYECHSLTLHPHLHLLLSYVHYLLIIMVYSQTSIVKVMPQSSFLLTSNSSNALFVEINVLLKFISKNNYHFLF